MKVLIVGTGWTGNKVFKEIEKHGMDYVHITTHQSAADQLETIDYDWVINCAGVTGVPNVDACEDDKWNTFQGNALFPIALQQECKKRNIRFAHFSSGCIYEGNVDSVDAKPNFFGSTYSTSKAISDQYLVDKAVVFRIRMPFTNVDEPKNYLTKIRKYAKTAKLWNGGQNSLTDHDESVRVAVKYILDDAPIGPYNLVNKGSVDLKEICQILDIQGDWYSDDEFFANTKCKRSNCVIPADNNMKDIREALHENRISMLIV